MEVYSLVFCMHYVPINSLKTIQKNRHFGTLYIPHNPTVGPVIRQSCMQVTGGRKNNFQLYANFAYVLTDVLGCGK